MKKSQKILLGSLVGVILLGGAAVAVGPTIYRDLIAEPADDAPTLSGDADMLNDTATPLTGEQLAGDWIISAGSEAGYRVDEVLSGTDVTVTGRTSEVTGSLTLSDDGTGLDAAAVTVDVASIATDNASRDAYFRDTALRAAEHPTAEFVLTKAIDFGSEPLASGEVREVDATGDLTIAGVTKSVTAPLQVRVRSDSAEIAGQLPITFADYDVEAPSLGFVSVEPEGFIELQLVAARG